MVLWSAISSSCSSTIATRRVALRGRVGDAIFAPEIDSNVVGAQSKSPACQTRWSSGCLCFPRNGKAWKVLAMEELRRNNSPVTSPENHKLCGPGTLARAPCICSIGQSCICGQTLRQSLERLPNGLTSRAHSTISSKLGNRVVSSSIEFGRVLAYLSVRRSYYFL